MKPIFSLLLTLMLGTAFGQTSIEFPYNPDSNGDGEIGVDDLLGMLSGFGEPWTLPDPNLWATGTITNLLDYESELVALSDSLEQMQLELDSVQSVLNSDVNGIILDHLSGTQYFSPHNPNNTFVITNPSTTFAWVRAVSSNNYGGHLHLTGEDKEVGDLLTILYRSSDGNSGTWQFKAQVNGSWSTIASCAPSGGFDNSGIPWHGSNGMFFKTFMWDGALWIPVE